LIIEYNIITICKYITAFLTVFIVNKRSLTFIMIGLIISIILSLIKDSTQKRTKTQKFGEIQSINNKTLIINPKTPSPALTCPLTGTQTLLTCFQAYAGVLEAIHATTYAAADVLTAVAAYALACPTLSCVEKCKNEISAKEFAPLDPAFEGKFLVYCNPIPAPTPSPAPAAAPSKDFDFRTSKSSISLMAISLMLASVHLLLA
jgi:hypothetical protein